MPSLPRRLESRLRRNPNPVSVSQSRVAPVQPLPDGPL